MAKWHGFGRCKTRLSIDIGKTNSTKIQSVMTKHTLAIAKSLEKKGLIDISLAVSGLGLKSSKRWSQQYGIQNYNLQGRGCLGEKMKRQILKNKKFCLQKKIKNIIFIGTDLPDLCQIDLLNTLTDLKKNDLILGPSNDGGYWLIAFSEKILTSYLYFPFVSIPWGTENVIQNTINNFSSLDLKFKFLQTKEDVDTIIDIDNRNNKLDKNLHYHPYL